MTAKITGIRVQDFKRVKLVEIQPCENGLTILGGRNAQGKSSVLDAIAYALGGEAFRPSDINNHDAEGNARIRVEIDGLVVERAGKNGALKITDSRGMRGNQTLLNEIVSRFALDLGPFMQANDTEKAKRLLNMSPQLEGKLAKLKAKADETRVQRADFNRDRKRLQAQFDAMPKEDAPTQEINVLVIQDQLGEANADRMKAMNEKVEINSLENQALAEDDKATNAENESRHWQERLEDYARQYAIRREKLLEEIRQAEQRLKEFDEGAPADHQIMQEAQANARKEAEEHRAKAEALRKDAEERKARNDAKLATLQGRIEELQAQARTATETNESVRRNKARESLYNEIQALDVKIAGYTRSLDEIEAARTALLQEAQLPLPELSITEDGKLLYRGQEWDCMSGSERLKVATAICMKAKPNCGFVLIDGLEAMDRETLEEFGKYLESQRMQGIGTIVGDNAATVIIEDGRVKGPVDEPTLEEEITRQLQGEAEDNNQ